MNQRKPSGSQVEEWGEVDPDYWIPVRRLKQRQDQGMKEEDHYATPTAITIAVSNTNAPSYMWHL